MANRMAEISIASVHDDDEADRKLRQFVESEGAQVVAGSFKKNPQRGTYSIEAVNAT